MAEHETIADIIAEKRRRADEIERDCAEKMKRGEMTSDQYARELVADIRREADRLEAAHESERGDCAKLREALKATLDMIFDLQVRNRSPIANSVYAVRRKIKAALASPPRNCDVGTAEEQRKRFGEFCQSHSWHEIDGEHCRASCPLYHGDKAPCDELEWAQMPYESEAAK